MRTTPNIDDEILEAARSIAGDRGLPVGAVLSQPERRGLHRTDAGRREREGFPMFDVSRDGTPLTLDRAKRHEGTP